MMTSLLEARRPRLLLTILCVLLWAPGFWTLPPTDRDESRFAQATKQMVETGDYVRIMNGTEARNRKPIGIHWLQAPFAIAAQRLGVAAANPIWPYRLPSALGALAAVLACFEIGAITVGRRAALLGAAMLAASALLVTEVHIAKTDAALLGATTLAMAMLGRAYLRPDAMRRRHAALFWLALGAGVLLKGPITPLIAGLTAATLAIMDRRAAWLRSLRPGWGVPLMLAVVLPWFVAIGIATDGRFFTDAVTGDLGRKLASGDDAHGGPPGLHLLLLPLLLFPAVAALPGGLALAWRDRGLAPVRLLLAWLVPAWLVFEATPTKLPHYTLPLYPPLCLLMAWAVLDGTAWRWRRTGAALAGLGAAILAVIAVSAPELLQQGWWLGLPALLGLAATSWYAVRGWQPGAAIGAAVAAVLFYAGALGFESTALTSLWIAPRVVQVIRSYPRLASARIGAVGFSEPSLMFLASTDTLWLPAEEGAVALKTGMVGVLLVADRDLAATRADLAGQAVAVREVGTVGGFNYSRGRRVVLTILAPAD